LARSTACILQAGLVAMVYFFYRLIRLVIALSGAGNIGLIHHAQRGALDQELPFDRKSTIRVMCFFSAAARPIKNDSASSDPLWTAVRLYKS
jgi:hypothetical protein